MNFLRKSTNCHNREEQNKRRSYYIKGILYKFLHCQTKNTRYKGSDFLEYSLLNFGIVIASFLYLCIIKCF